MIKYITLDPRSNKQKVLSINLHLKIIVQSGQPNCKFSHETSTGDFLDPMLKEALLSNTVSASYTKNMG